MPPWAAPPDPPFTVPPPPRRPSTLGLRIVGVTLLVAVLVATIAALVSLAAVRQTAREANATRLSQQADLLIVELQRSSGTGADRTELLNVLAAQGISVVLIDGAAADSTDRRAQRAVQAAGLLSPGATLPVSTSVNLAGARYLVEERALPGEQQAFALVGSADEGAVMSRVLLRRILLAMLIGLAVAIPVALLLARLVTTPLRRTAAVADAMGSGRRDVRVKTGGPAEVRAVAESVNRLADDLALSEGRQQRFLASVSHELRTPLAAVSGLADAMTDGLVPPDEVAQVGRTIRGETARLEGLVTDLLDLARMRADDFTLDLTVVDLVAVVGEMIRAWGPRCEQQGVLLRFDPPSGSVPVVADPSRLRQVLDGLAGNAIRQLAAGRPLVFAVFALPGGAGRAEIRDGGPGLTAADYADMFQPGVLHERYRQVRPVGGAGLGLALAAGLVARMGGTIDGRPAPEGGVCIGVTLPPGQPGAGVPGTAG